MIEEKEIMSIMHGFYSNRFTTEGSQGKDEVLAGILHLITERVNHAFTKAASEEEVRYAVFQMRGSRAPGPDGYPDIFY